MVKFVCLRNERTSFEYAKKKTGYYGLNIVPSLDQAIGSLKKPLGIPIPNRIAKWYENSPYRSAILDANQAAYNHDGAIINYLQSGAELPLQAAKVHDSEAAKDEAWHWVEKHSRAVLAQQAYETARDILYERHQKETQQTQAHQLTIYGQLKINSVIEAAHKELESAGVGHAKSPIQSQPPRKAYTTPPLQSITLGQPQYKEFPTYEELNTTGRFEKKVLKFDPSENLTYERARDMICNVQTYST